MTTAPYTNSLRARFSDAKKALEAAGWFHSHSVMHDGGANAKYGSCFLKCGEGREYRTFYLNKDTVDNLPI